MAGKNIALLIDADNASDDSMESAMTHLAGLGAVNVRRAYGNWSKDHLKGWAQRLHAFAITPVQQFDLTTGKNATDMAMTIDAMDLLHGGRIDGFALMSSDSDFTPLVMRLRQNGLPVYGFGSKKAPQPFRDACTRFVDLTAVDAKVQKPAPSAAPKAVSPKAFNPPAELLRQLKAVFESIAHDGNGWTALSPVGNQLKAQFAISASDHGFGQLNKMFAAMSQHFQMKSNGSGQYLVKPKDQRKPAVKAA